jgi:hypothetical protein
MVPAVRREGGGSGRFCGGRRCGLGIVANLRTQQHIMLHLLPPKPTVNPRRMVACAAHGRVCQGGPLCSTAA